MDDQIARVKVAGDSGAMLVIEDPSLENLTNSINKMLDPVNRDKMIQSMESLKLGNGAEEVAEYLIDHNSRR
jgi:hypothetical protein